MSYSLEKRAHCRSLYVESGLSFERVSAMTGVSLSQLKVWGREDNWVSLKEECESQLLEIDAHARKLRLDLAIQACALKGQSSQDLIAKGNALKHLEESLRQRLKYALEATPDRPSQFLDFIGKFIEYLKNVDGEALRYLEPHLRGFAETMKQPEAA